jgi:serine/threonine protein phosphatase PrpC
MENIKTLEEMVDYSFSPDYDISTLNTILCRTKTHVVSSTKDVLDLGKGQDFVYFGFTIDKETTKPCFYKILIDCHGSNKCIDFIRDINKHDWNEIMAESNPLEKLVNEINTKVDIYPRESSGGTFISWKCFDDYAIECSCGDSQSFVFINDTIEYTSPIHNGLNPSEQDRILNLGMRFEETNTYRVVDNEIKQIKSFYTVLHTNNRLAVTQAIGHRGITEYAQNTKKIIIQPYDKVIIKSVSDGITDMLDQNYHEDMSMIKTLDSTQLVDIFMKRWCKDWNYFDEETKERIVINFSRDPDDVSCIDVIYRPIVTNIFSFES